MNIDRRRAAHARLQLAIGRDACARRARAHKLGPALSNNRNAMRGNAPAGGVSEYPAQKTALGRAANAQRAAACAAAELAEKRG